MERVDLVLQIVALIFDIELSILQLLQHVELRGLRIVEFLFKLNDVGRCTLKLFLQLRFGHLHRVMMSLPRPKLHFDVLFLLQASLEFELGCIELNDVLVAFLQSDLELVYFQLVIFSQFFLFNC